MHEMRQIVQTQTELVPALKVRMRRSTAFRVRNMRKSVHSKGHVETTRGLAPFDRSVQV